MLAQLARHLHPQRHASSVRAEELADRARRAYEYQRKHDTLNRRAEPVSQEDPLIQDLPVAWRRAFRFAEHIELASEPGTREGGICFDRR